MEQQFKAGLSRICVNRTLEGFRLIILNLKKHAKNLGNDLKCGVFFLIFKKQEIEN